MIEIPKFIVLVGIPASGKSVHAKKLAQKYSTNIIENKRPKFM